MSIDRRTFIGGLVAGLGAIGLASLTSLIPRKLCVWNLGTKCTGQVKNREMFSNQIVVPVCDHHFTGHREIMGCHKHGFDVEKIMRWSQEARRRIIDHFNIPLGKA